MPNGSAPATAPSRSPDGDAVLAGERLHLGEVVFITGDMLIWTILLAVGIFISSQPYRLALETSQPRWVDYAYAWFMAFVSYTFTNLAMLSGLASIAGAGARRVEAQLAGESGITNLRALYTSAAVRGFFVYLIALSGLMFLAEGLFTNIARGPDVYIRLAGSISILSFMLGFNPAMFARFLERTARILEDQGSRSKS